MALQYKLRPEFSSYPSNALQFYDPIGWTMISSKHLVLTDPYFEVVAPPISSGTRRLDFSISLATYIISSSDGVINPESPTMSTV